MVIVLPPPGDAYRCVAKRKARLMADDETKYPVKPQLVVTLFTVFLLGLITTVIVAHFAQSVTASRQNAFRPVDDLLAIRFDHGWVLVSGPADDGRYRIIGATESDPSAGADSIRGAFATDDRSIEFDLPIPEGKAVAVEGLAPIDGGPLAYAVLTRDRL